MNITKALKLAQDNIYVSYHGGYYVAMPYRGLSDVGGPTNAATSTCDYRRAIAHCREIRIREVVAIVTGDSDYAAMCSYDTPTTEDWRSEARRHVRAYNREAQA